MTTASSASRPLAPNSAFLSDRLPFSKGIVPVFTLLCLAVGLGGCGDLSGQWNAFLDSLKTGGVPASGRPRPGASPSGLGVSAELSKANSELLHEVFTVVFGQEPADKALFGSYVDSLNQGASLEGVYNGF